MNTIEKLQFEVDAVIRAAENDLDKRGVLYLDRAQTLLSAMKNAQFEMAIVERNTPPDFFNTHWPEQHKQLHNLQSRLTRIINGTEPAPPCNHQRT